jgi:hypothetical protein
MKEGVLWTVIAIKILLASDGFNPWNLGSNGMHANHYTTEEIKSVVK